MDALPLVLALFSCAPASYDNPVDPNNAGRLLVDSIYRAATAPVVDSSACIGADETGHEPANDAAGSAIEILSGQTNAGRLCAADVDYWVFTPASDSPSVAFYTKLPADAMSAATPADTVLSLYNAAGTLLSTNDDGYVASSTPASTKFSCSTAGVTANQGVLIKVTGFDQAVTGHYDITFRVNDSCVSLNQ